MLRARKNLIVWNQIYAIDEALGHGVCGGILMCKPVREIKGWYFTRKRCWKFPRDNHQLQVMTKGFYIAKKLENQMMWIQISFCTF